MKRVQKWLKVGGVLAMLAGMLLFAKYHRWLTEPEDARDEAAARERVPFVSLEERLPQGKPVPNTASRSDESLWQWKNFEGVVQQRRRARLAVLQGLHSWRGAALASETIAYDKESRICLEGILKGHDEGYLKRMVPQPSPGADLLTVSADDPSVTLIKPGEDFYHLHLSALVAFVEPPYLGYAKSRKRVAGFGAHGFRDYDKRIRHTLWWRVEHIQLVGILATPKPVVYVTENLPTMESVRGGRTRELDEFEARGLTAIERGEDLYLIRKGDTVRMLGAIRATRSCQPCHGDRTGDLLGAFTYILREEPVYSWDGWPASQSKPSDGPSQLQITK